MPRMHLSRRLLCNPKYSSQYRFNNHVFLIKRDRSLTEAVLIYFGILPFHLCLSLPRCLFSPDFLTESLYLFCCPSFVLHLSTCHSY
jgi:hypothetical protein